MPTHYIGPAHVSDFPRGAPAITSEEVDQLLDATVSTSNGNGNDASPEAPFGYKADGVTPRKRPYPDWLKDPQKLAAAAQKRSRSTTGRSRSRANGRPAISNGEAGVLARTTREIESEEQRLAGIVRELRAQREQLVAELAQLDESVAAAEERARSARCRSRRAREGLSWPPRLCAGSHSRGEQQDLHVAVTVSPAGTAAPMSSRTAT